jgi:hypothetical protein
MPVAGMHAELGDIPQARLRMLRLHNIGPDGHAKISG